MKQTIMKMIKSFFIYNNFNEINKNTFAFLGSYLNIHTIESYLQLVYTNRATII